MNRNLHPANHSVLVWSLDQTSTLMVLISAGSTNVKDDASNNVLALRPFIQFVYCEILKIVMGRSFNEAVSLLAVHCP